MLDNINYRINHIRNIPKLSDEYKDLCLDIIATAHHEFVCIHPYMNGNGRMGRVLINLIAILLDLEFFTLFDETREEESKYNYLKALRDFDEGNKETLKQMLEREYKLVEL